MPGGLKERFCIATMCENWRDVAEAHGLGIESDHFCQAENMDGEKGVRAKADLSQTVKKYDVRVLHAPFNELHPAAIDYRARELAMSRLNQAAEIAIDLGIKKVIVHSGYVPFVYFKEWHMLRSVEFWQEYMETKPDDFEICIENVLDDEPYTLTEIAEKIGDDRVGLCLDVGHANVVNHVYCNGAASSMDVTGDAGTAGKTSIIKWLEVMAPHLKHLHIHNNDGTGDFHKELMDGIIDMKEVLDGVIKYCKPDTTITMEVLNIENSIEWLKDKNLF